MKNYFTKKKITITVLAFVAVFLVGGLWLHMDSMKNKEPAKVFDDATTPEQESDDLEISVPIGSERSTQSTQGEQATEETESGGSEAQENVSAGSITITDGTGTGGQSKPSDGKPKTPAEATPPETPGNVTQNDNGTNSSPDSSTTAPANPEPDTPQGGETNSSGAIYVPGFGWVEDSGEENSQGTAPNAGTGDVVGDM